MVLHLDTKQQPVTNQIFASILKPAPFISF